VADTDESFLVLEFAPDDGDRGAFAVWVVLLLALNGDVVPGECSVRVRFDDSLFGCESRMQRGVQYDASVSVNC